MAIRIFGIRSDQTAFLDHQELFFKNVFFPTLKERNIKRIVHLGDLVDRRKYINYHTLSRMKEMFLNHLSGHEVHILSGNHDLFYRNTSTINALNELLVPYPNIKIYTNTTEVTIGHKKHLMVPWINSENKEQSFRMIKDFNRDVCFGHLEIKGFQIQPGHVAEFGDDPSLFKNIKHVFSGHYHSKSSRDNIHYLGAPFQFTWNDFGEERGFHIYDTNTEELEFVDNPYSMFVRLTYEGNDTVIDRELEIKNCYVKIIVKEKSSQSNFEAYLRDIESRNPLDVKIVETTEIMIENEAFSGSESTQEIMKKYVEMTTLHIDKTKLNNLLLKLYTEASTDN